MTDLLEAFRALRHAPRALWLIAFAFSVDAMAYFGILPLMKAYLGQDIGIAPALASTWVSLFTGSLTILMMLVGLVAESKLGIRKGILFALVLAAVGRAIYGSAPFVGGAVAIAVSFAIVALGEAILQPVAYAGVKLYTDEKNGAMGYAMLYALMNLAVAFIGPISAYVRTTFDAKRAAGTSALSGFNAVNWVCFGITVFAAAFFGLLMTPHAESAVVRRPSAPIEPIETATPSANAAQNASTAKGASPFADRRFLFFIFALLPVRTLFAHQWLTMPEYVLRAYNSSVGDRMEYLVDSMNPILIFFGVPIITALTRRFAVLTMMIAGSLVSASATFLLCFGSHASLLIAYFFVFSIGEALWSPRFLEYTAERAPPGRVAQYMGVANLPWFVAKTTTGLYSGIVLEHFCPKDGAKNPTQMWLLYGVIAMASPVLLILARRWLSAVDAGAHMNAPSSLADKSSSIGE
ncbi:MAG: MFS transporter [Polyangiaceae bacterium]|nr:MFS transporter [Polyangiaceae bacterium]